MLHLLTSLIALLALPEGAPCALEKLSRVDFATQAHKAQLRQCIILQTIFIKGVPRADKYVLIPGRGPRTFGGVRLKINRVLSVIGVTQGYNLSLVQGRSAEAEHVDPKTGIAILGVKTSGISILKPSDKVTPGRVFFAIDEDSQLHRFVVMGKGGGTFGYYWHAEVRLALGTPVFNARGEWISLIALSAERTGSYLLPQEAFEGVTFLQEPKP